MDVAEGTERIDFSVIGIDFFCRNCVFVKQFIAVIEQDGLCSLGDSEKLVERFAALAVFNVDFCKA